MTPVIVLKRSWPIDWAMEEIKF